MTRSDLYVPAALMDSISVLRTWLNCVWALVEDILEATVKEEDEEARGERIRRRAMLKLEGEEIRRSIAKHNEGMGSDEDKGWSKEKKIAQELKPFVFSDRGKVWQGKGKHALHNQAGFIHSLFYFFFVLLSIKQANNCSSALIMHSHFLLKAR